MVKISFQFIFCFQPLNFTFLKTLWMGLNFVIQFVFEIFCSKLRFNFWMLISVSLLNALKTNKQKNNHAKRFICM